MSSIAPNRIIALAVLAMVSCAVSAGDTPPRILQEPILGLRYEVAKVKFEPLPARALVNCETLVDNEHTRGVWFVLGRAHDASGRTFYVVDGYEIRHDPEPPKYPKYVVGGDGIVFQTEGDQCTVIGGVRETFGARSFDETPLPILRRLAADIMSRYVRAFGGSEQLRMELRNQHVDQDQLSPELREVFTPYFGR